MSIAKDRLSAVDRMAIAESLLIDPKPFKADELGGHCPFHREETPGGAFFYNFEIDAAHCHSCGADADLVGIFNAVTGRATADPDGCAEFVRKYCPEDGSRPVVSQDRKPHLRREWQPKPLGLPADLWMDKAASFVEHAVERLQSSPERLTELAGWGIDSETARKCRFGWNDRDKWPPVTAWGLPLEQNEQGKEKKIWLPEGLVMPAIRDGQVLKLKIRRPDPVTPWGESRKYWEVKGGANGLYHTYGNPLNRVWMVMETERDAALVWQYVHDLGIGAMGNGGASKRPSGYVADILARAKVILNALDFDQAGTTNTYAFWEQEYPTSIRYPAPPSMGKDVGDAVANGLDIRQWVLDGLPNFVKRELFSNSKPTPSKTASTPAPAPKPYIEIVLDKMEADGLPLWRAEVIAFREHLQANGLRIFRRREGGLWVGCADESRYADKAVGVLVFEARQRFHAARTLDEWIEETSLEAVVRGFFGDRLEVRG